MAKIINTSGKRKTAIARATLKAGKGVIRVNSVPLEMYGTDVTRMKISEPILLFPKGVDGVDVTIDVAGGGVMGQAEAVRTAFLTYDRTLLVNDSRQKEAKKPHGRGARKKFQKSYR